jgi:hypothetical protein
MANHSAVAIVTALSSRWPNSPKRDTIGTLIGMRDKQRRAVARRLIPERIIKTRTPERMTFKNTMRMTTPRTLIQTMARSARRTKEMTNMTAEMTAALMFTKKETAQRNWRR